MLFDRVASIVIGSPSSSNAIQLDGLKIVFTVTKDATKNSNRADVQIFNLSETTRNALSGLSKIGARDEVLILKAGYKQEHGAEVLFVGNIASMTHTFAIPETITKISANDGGKAMRDAVVSVSYAQGAPLDKILTDALKALAIPKKVVASLGNKKLNNALAFQGRVVDLIEQVVKTGGAEFSVQNGEAKVIAQGATDDSRAIFISPDHGLIGSPERLENSSDESSPEQKKPGWKIRSLLQPKVEPGGVVAFKSRDIPEGQFRVEKVIHRGDTHGEAWETEIELLEARRVA